MLGGLLASALLLLVAFAVIETRVAEPMFHLALFRIRAFAAGSLAALLVAVARGGMQFMLIIWLQGIWLPLHGYDFADTPLWAGIYLLPLTAGFLVAGPLCGHLSDRYGARLFTTGGLLLMAGSFVGLLALPVDFAYWDVRGAAVRQRDRAGHVLGAEHLGDDEQRPAGRPRGGVRDALDVPELGHRAVDRGVLLADDGGSGRVAAGRAHRRPGRARRTRRRPRRTWPACRR